MALSYFCTIYDSDSCELDAAGDNQMSRIGSFAVIYSVCGRNYIDRFNTNCGMFARMRDSKVEYAQPNVPREIFLPLFEDLNERGFDRIYVVVPNAAFSPYDEEVRAAIKYYNAKAKKQNTETASVYLINGRCFGAATLYFTHYMSNLSRRMAVTRDRFARLAAEHAQTSLTLMLVRGESPLDGETRLRAYIISGSHVKPLNISESVESVKFDSFANAVARKMNKLGCGYVVSYGCDCDFGDNILGRVKMLTRCNPVLTAQYGIPTSHMLGTRSVLFHLGDYIPQTKTHSFPVRQSDCDYKLK